MKKLFIAAAFVLTFTKSYAAAPVDIEINGQYIKSDVEPIIENGSVLMPIRAAAEALGCDNISWDAKTQSVTVDDGRIQFSIGENHAIADGKVIELSAAAKIVNDRTLVPLRFFAESFGADVQWNEKTYTVEISLADYTVPERYTDTSYTKTELKWLAQIVNAEAEGEPMQGKTAVANVILNRVESTDFPDNIYDVIFDRKYGVQFTPVANGRIYNEAGADSYIAAKNALKGENIIGDSLYFCNPEISTNFWIINNRKYYTTIGKHSFYL